LAALAGILFMVAYNMGDWAEIPEILKLTKMDIAVWLVTLSLTVLADLTVAVEVGMILAAFSFIRKISMTITVTEVTEDYIEHGRAHILQDKTFLPMQPSTVSTALSFLVLQTKSRLSQRNWIGCRLLTS
jgi:SulP family sulfate permease